MKWKREKIKKCQWKLSQWKSFRNNQAEDLEKLHDKTDFLKKIKMLSEENRSQGERIRDLENKLRSEHEGNFEI